MRRIVLMLALVVAGEMVFGLAFNVPRFFRPTMLEVFGLSNTELGDIFAVYGVGAMLAYFPGGTLADRFSARSLITASLLLTSLGGVYMATFPGVELMAIYGWDSPKQAALYTREVNRKKLVDGAMHLIVPEQIMGESVPFSEVVEVGGTLRRKK